MPLYSYKEFRPKIGKNCFIAPSADVIGEVELDDGVTVWHGTSIRGDMGSIKIGKNTNIQDNSVLHITEGHPLKIGSGVTVGHAVTLHSCTVENNCLIGMGSVILDDAVIGEKSLVAAGSVVTPGKKFPPKSLIMGSPAKLIRELNQEEMEAYNNQYKHYEPLRDLYLSSDVVRIDANND